MKFWNILSIAIACCISSQALADIQLTIPSQVKLQLVNGEKSASTSPVLLKNGQNQIAFRYQDRYRVGGDDVFYSSDIIIMNFAGKDDNYVMAIPKLTSQAERDAFNEKPCISLKDSQSQDVLFEQGKLLKNGMQFDRDLVAEMKDYNLTSQPASLQQRVTIITTPGTQSEVDVAGKMLDYWYQKADRKTREQFKLRISQ